MIIVSHKPSSYLLQPAYRFCWACQLTTIADSKGIILTTSNPIHLFSWINKITWLCSPSYLHKRFTALDMDVCMNEWGTLDDLKQALANNQIPILLVAHGYNDAGEGFNYIRATLFQHYISVRGYDPVNDGFRVYDSAIKTPSPWLPIGNLFLPSRLLAQCRVWWWLMFYNNLFITIV